ncbi:hypothetical protein BJ973_006654 [Actinoplanes tereljensis]|uniref:Uncharacterized protein n=1 Tax=Paractinoplanes tereljensis TaxID=571912 RepID=A0A919TRU9_9ACTN|nr:hypothetical protein [Actinoplanes tereljensis]GIF19609.1 hypothetical protein Ate02nite_23390 [Actinoplanes tereljensis]
MAKPRTPPHGGSPEPTPQSGGGGSGGDPPKRRTTASDAGDDPESVRAAEARLARIRPSNPTKDKNTVVLPGTDVAADLADISAGRGNWNAETNRYEVNGRSYGVESTGTVFPVSGPGFVNLSRPEYKVLKQLIGADGDLDAAQAALRRDPSISAADWRSALEVFKHHKSYRGGA